MSRKGEFFFTFTGIQFWPLDPRPEEITIEDIAHGLAYTCRWGGQCKEFYSVAQHSVEVSYEVPPQLALIALMHDAPEAYIGDVKRPIKDDLANYREIERGIWLAIAERFGLPKCNPCEWPEVKEADNRALITERRDLMHSSVCRVPWPIDALKLEPWPHGLHAFPNHVVEQMFLNRFHELA